MAASTDSAFLDEMCERRLTKYIGHWARTSPAAGLGTKESVAYQDLPPERGHSNSDSWKLPFPTDRNVPLNDIRPLTRRTAAYCMKKTRNSIVEV